MTEDQLYSRQIYLKEIGNKGQDLLKNSRVLIVGAGGLGHPVGTYLAAGGVGQITICDFDKVEYSNLNRQVCFTCEDVGKFKSSVLQEALVAQNPFIRVDSLREKITPDNAKEILAEFDIVVDCCDNFSTKFLLHDCCWLLNKALVQASVYQYEGQLQVFDYRSLKQARACLRCLWPKTPDNNCVSNCQQSGIVGAVVGVFGSMQAMEVIKLITSIGECSTNGFTHTINLLNLDMQRVRWSKNSDCPLCSDHAHITSIDYENYHELSQFEVLSLNSKNSNIIDIRELDECKTKDFGLKNYPLSEFDQWVSDLSKQESYTFVCAKGKRSLELVKKLTAQGYTCKSLYGGLDEN
ncbi:HesA/MoeB/ThiF family protein [Halobacteriovorax sp. HLS]|uniref:HesA/MoeB/ThiF family protein n=1 Tax=Halobacteriovorax sp. HLS TaxID=2234000 RepID=UPI000FDAD493|nr:HesA/MoeB/ThiF family protein [Halobacteriovorax sp. HLS]